MKRPGWVALLSCFAVVLSFQNCAKSMPNIQADEASLAAAEGACMLDGQVIGNGQAITAYSSSSAPSASQCSQLAETRTCTDGSLSGSSGFLSCSVVVQSQNVITLTLATNASNYNIAQVVGTLTSPVTVNLTISAGVTVSSANASSAALATGNFPAGSTINIYNNGMVVGAGGTGGAGGAYDGSPTNGASGGTALSLNFPVTISNSGTIAGGGGGGGGGAGCSGRVAYGAGGGGGGAGSLPGVGGAGGADPQFGYPGTAGGVGSSTTGGAPGQPGYPLCTVGGAGGALGQPGGAGATSGSYNGNVFPAATAPGSGGAAGAAVVSNGQTVHWISGGTAPNVLGAVN